MSNQRIGSIDRIAVLMTCYNRRDVTLACLKALMNQTEIDEVELQVYLVDDGCADGTGEAVKREYPEVTLIQGDGTLFWCGGMRLAWAEAMKRDYDYYLWLNDDTYIFENTIRKMVDTSTVLSEREGRAVILTGSTRAPGNEICTYGGVKMNGFHTYPAFEKISPSDLPKRCDTINGNCVLIPREVADRVGNLSSAFIHGAGDYDYGLRARKLGISSWIAGGYVGECAGHAIEGIFHDPALSIGERTLAMRQPTAIPSIREWLVFTRRHAGWLWPLCWLRTRMRLFSPRLWMYWRGRK